MNKMRYFLIIIVILTSCNNKTNEKNFRKTEISIEEQMSDTNKTDSFHFTKDNILELKTDADSNYKENNYYKAIKLFNQLIRLDSTKGEYYFKRGYSYSMMLNGEDAIKDYLKSAAMGYRVSTSYQNIGANYSTINDSLAVYYLNESLKYDPDNKVAMRVRSECMERLNKSK